MTIVASIPPTIPAIIFNTVLIRITSNCNAYTLTQHNTTQPAAMHRMKRLLDGGEAGGYDAVYVDLVFSIEVEVVA